MTQYLLHHTLARTICDTLLVGEHRIETSLIDPSGVRRRGLRKTAVVTIEIPAIDARPFHESGILAVANTLLSGSKHHPLRAKNFAHSRLGGGTGTLNIEASYELPFKLAEKRPENERAQFLHGHAMHSLAQVVAADQVPYDYAKRSKLLAAFPDPRNEAEIRNEERWHAFLFWMSKWQDLIPKRIPRDFGEYE
jgi:hypothetical protein